MTPETTTCLIVKPNELPDPAIDVAARDTEQVAVLAGGCFWCVEAVYQGLDGVLSVTSGYAGGSAESADYQAVCSGRTDHAEVVEVGYDPAKTSYGELLKVFFGIAHDPTQLDRQGADVGRQYRSAIFYADEEQREVAEAYVGQLEDAAVFTEPIVTTIEPLETFYPAEEYHQDYAERNPAQPYVAFNAAPKVQKLREYFGDRVREE